MKRSAKSTCSPSTATSISPSVTICSPVAVTITSASSVAPDSSWMPVSVTVRMRSVTTDAEPLRIAANRSPSGTRHRRWSHGPYVGVKWVSTS